MVIVVNPLVPAIGNPFRYQVITGVVPALVLLKVKLTDSPAQSDVLEAVMLTVCDPMGETATVILLVVITEGLAQDKLLVSCAVI